MKNIIELIEELLVLERDKSFRKASEILMDPGYSTTDKIRSKNIIFKKVIQKFITDKRLEESMPTHERNFILEQIQDAEDNGDISDTTFYRILSIIEDCGYKALTHYYLDMIIPDLKDLATSLGSTTSRLELDEIVADSDASFKKNKVKNALNELTLAIRTKAHLAGENRRISENMKKRLQFIMNLRSDINDRLESSDKVDFWTIKDDIQTYIKEMNKTYNYILNKIDEPVNGSGFVRSRERDQVQDEQEEEIQYPNDFDHVDSERTTAGEARDIQKSTTQKPRTDSQRTAEQTSRTQSTPSQEKPRQSSRTQYTQYQSQTRQATQTQGSASQGHSRQTAGTQGTASQSQTRQTAGTQRSASQGQPRQTAGTQGSASQGQPRQTAGTQKSPSQGQSRQTMGGRLHKALNAFTNRRIVRFISGGLVIVMLASGIYLLGKRNGSKQNDALYNEKPSIMTPVDDKGVPADDYFIDEKDTYQDDDLEEGVTIPETPSQIDVSIQKDPSTVATTTQENVVASTTTVQENWSQHGESYSQSDVEEISKTLNGQSSTVSVETADEIIIDMLNKAIAPGINNILAGENNTTSPIKITDLLVGDKPGIEAVKRMEANLNGCMTDPANIKEYCENAFLDEALLVCENKTIDGLNVSEGSTTDPILRIVWARLAQGLNAYAGTLGDSLYVELDGKIYTQDDINNGPALSQIVKKAMNDMGIDSKTLN